MWNPFKKKKSWTVLVNRVLIYFLNYEKEKIPIKELKSEFSKGELTQVRDFLKNYDFVEENIKNRTLIGYIVKNKLELLREVQKLGGLISIERVQKEESSYRMTSIFLTVYLLLFTGIQVYSTFLIALPQQQLSSEQYILSNYADLEIRSWDNLSEQNVSSKHSLCLLNRGSINSGNISLVLSNNGSQIQTLQISPMEEKSFSCSIIHNNIVLPGSYTLDAYCQACKRNFRINIETNSRG